MQSGAPRQRLAFAPAPAGKRKVVLATNIAETSITIDDVAHVIDCGHVKELRWSPASGFSALAPVWVSQARAQLQGTRGQQLPAELDGPRGGQISHSEIAEFASGQPPPLRDQQGAWASSSSI